MVSAANISQRLGWHVDLLLLFSLLIATVIACFVTWLAWRGQASAPPPPPPSRVSEEVAFREQMQRLFREQERQERLRRATPTITVRTSREWPSDEFVRMLNTRLFSRCAESVALFQPKRTTLAEGIPAWHCPPLVMGPYNAAAINAGEPNIELVVLQPAKMRYRDKDDGRRSFLLPLDNDSFQVMQVPKCSQDVPFKVLQWSEVRLLLSNGYRSVGRDNIVDYGRPVPVAKWEDRHALPRYGVEFFSIAVSTDDARRIARYATGRLLRHIRHLRPRGSLSIEWQYEDGASPKIRLIFMQRYSFNIYPTRSITGRLLSVGYDHDDDDNEYPDEGAAVDVSVTGEVLRIHLVRSNPDEFVLAAGSESAIVS
jgi:hypothetical protein